MLAARAPECPLPVFKKRTRGGDFSDKNAFSRTETLFLSVRVPRALGAMGVVLRGCTDGGEDADRPFCFSGCDGAWDSFTLSLNLSDISGETGGLFHYELLFLRGERTLFSRTDDNCTLTLCTQSRGRFCLLVYEAAFETPQRFHGRTMYHVFVDRFAPRGGTRRQGALYHARWEEELLQFGVVPGAPVANNEFFGGTLWGVLEKLDYLQALGVNVLYLSPIFRADSNHKYDTGDYEEIDAQFGGGEAFSALLAECRRRDIWVILDGVFNHTGDDSKYFNKRGNYDTFGAFCAKESPYYSWYFFMEHPHRYLCWWDIPILPKLNLKNPEVHRYFLGERGVIGRYLEQGVSGWRLDVADELPNSFLEDLRALVKEKRGQDGVVLGEVWENAAHKIAYGERRRYFLGRQLDGVMNYPLREGLIAFARDGNAGALCRVLRELWASYPTTVCHSLMNILSTHDTERILTVLGGDPAEGHSNAELRDMRLGAAQRRLAKRQLQIAAALQYTLYGVPSLFYGDEAGLEGYHDPFCRRPYPWGREDHSLLTFYKKLGKIRSENTVLREGHFRILLELPHAVVFERRDRHGRLIVAANRGEADCLFKLPRASIDLLSGKRADGRVSLPPDTVQIWRVSDVQTGMGKVDKK